MYFVMGLCSWSGIVFVSIYLCKCLFDCDNIEFVCDIKLQSLVLVPLNFEFVYFLVLDGENYLFLSLFREIHLDISSVYVVFV